MDKMWSPWRSKYIESFKDKTDDERCIFCTAQNDAAENENSLVVYQGQNCFIILNLYPYNNGHLMIVPNRHMKDVRDLSKEEFADVHKLINAAITALEIEMKPQGFNIGVNMGKAAGAGIDTHLHFHIVPRWNGDTNFMPVLGEVKVISQDLIIAKQKLATAISKVLRD